MVFLGEVAVSVVAVAVVVVVVVAAAVADNCYSWTIAWMAYLHHPRHSSGTSCCYRSAPRKMTLLHHRTDSSSPSPWIGCWDSRIQTPLPNYHTWTIPQIALEAVAAEAWREEAGPEAEIPPEEGPGLRRHRRRKCHPKWEEAPPPSPPPTCWKFRINPDWKADFENWTWIRDERVAIPRKTEPPPVRGRGCRIRTSGSSFRCLPCWCDCDWKERRFRSC
mmetsp:Transcript_14242/g.29907  ORF Transcript_14242/g.29907 Transcript_14242/m.29907 type:complete len:220 (+) Transcript_14242:150-809(+)